MFSSKSSQFSIKMIKGFKIFNLYVSIFWHICNPFLIFM